MVNIAKHVALLLVFAFTMTTCSAAVSSPAVNSPTETNPVPNIPVAGSTPSEIPAVESPAVASPTALLQVTPTTTYLPTLTKYSNHVDIFGVDGRTYLDKMGAAGVRWLRLNSQLRWMDIEPSDNQYDWSKASHIDYHLTDAANNGLQVVLPIMTAPTWARKHLGSVCGPIRQDYFDEFGDFVFDVVTRYSQSPYNVKYFQIWNEPDEVVNSVQSVFGCWGEPSETDPTYGGEYFGKMLSVVYPRLKAANPSAQLVLSSLLMMCDPRDSNPAPNCDLNTNGKTARFFEGILKTGKDSFDIVMFNSGPSYAQGINPVWAERDNPRWEGARGGLVNGKISYLRDAMAAHGIDKPIMHSEAYLLDRPDTQYDLFENQKADYLVWTYANGLSQKLHAVMWYSIEGWKGSELIRSDGGDTLAYRAMSAMVNITGKSEYIGQTDYDGFARFTFRTPTEEIWLLIPTGKEYLKPLSVAVPANFIRSADVYGQQQAVTGPTITFNRPYYIVTGY
jgi:hypothetical protein